MELASLLVFLGVASKIASVCCSLSHPILHPYYNRYKNEPTAAAAMAKRPPADTLIDRSPAFGFEAAVPLAVPLAALLLATLLLVVLLLAVV